MGGGGRGYLYATSPPVHMRWSICVMLPVYMNRLLGNFYLFVFLGQIYRGPPFPNYSMSKVFGSYFLYSSPSSSLSFIEGYLPQLVSRNPLSLFLPLPLSVLFFFPITYKKRHWKAVFRFYSVKKLQKILLNVNVIFFNDIAWALN